MNQAFRFIEISKYDDGGQVMPRGRVLRSTQYYMDVFIQCMDINVLTVEIYISSMERFRYDSVNGQ